MKNRILTLILREIKKNIRRFIYLSILSFLGVTVFVGITTSGDDMIKTLDVYYDENNVYDIEVISTLGLTQADISSISNLDDRFIVYGLHSKDSSFKHDNNNIGVIKIMEIDDEHNKVLLKEGRLPKKDDEIVIEESILRKTKIKIGDVIDLDLKDDDKTVNKKQLKVVGTVISPIYLTNGNGSISRGNTTIANGKIDFYSYVVKDFFNMDYYSQVNINVVNDYFTDSTEYKNLIDEVTKKLETIKKERETVRYNEVIAKANQEIDDKEKEALAEFDNAKKQLDSANLKLQEASNLLNINKNKLNSAKIELNNNLNKINDGKAKITNSQKELLDAKIKLDNGVNEINLRFNKYGLDYNDLLIIKKAIEGISLKKDEVITIIPENLKYYDSLVEVVNYVYDNGYNNYLSNLVNGINREKIISIIPTTINNYEEVCSYIRNVNMQQIKKAVIDYLLDTKNAERIKQKLPSNMIGYDYLVNAIDKYEITIEDILELLKNLDLIKNGYIDYNNGINEIEKSKKELSDGYEKYLKYLSEFKINEKLLKDKQVEYDQNFRLYQNNLEEYNIRKFDFEQNIKDARNEVNKIDNAKWYIYNRKDNADYVSFINSAQSVKKLAVTFPVIFFAVAIFISLISMSRMAFEDRGEIGTLKSLGFNNMQIRYKYIIYSLMATLLGGILGAFFGFYYISWIIFETYKILFAIPIFVYEINIIPIFIGIIISIICICGATIITINSLVKEKTTDLLRPKAPPLGKTILLEKIKFIWNRFSFSNKILVRNIFRYKRRIFMIILGIVGCTLLLLSGYAIKDSIVNIASVQYKDVFKYSDAVYLSDKLSVEQEKDVFNNIEHIDEKVYTKTLNIRSKEKDITLIVPNDEKSFNELFVLKDKYSENILKMEDNKIIITSKLAKLLKLKVNDNIEFIDINNKKYNFEISAITQNYIGYFAYMNKKTYESNFEDYKTNMIYIKVDNLENEKDVSTKLLENVDVLGVVSIEESLENIKSIFDSLNSVVIILVVFSGVLSFVVLYNLSYINISERQREIATLKVLGFNNKETDSYIIKEQIIITLIGIIIGLIVGTWFGMIIVETIEIDMAEFIKNITILSYFKTFVFMVLFSLIVNIKVHFTLKKINMIESLKSVE